LLFKMWFRFNLKKLRACFGDMKMMMRREQRWRRRGGGGGGGVKCGM
jgi:hypothetical protein